MGPWVAIEEATRTTAAAEGEAENKKIVGLEEVKAGPEVVMPDFAGSLMRKTIAHAILWTGEVAVERASLLTWS